MDAEFDDSLLEEVYNDSQHTLGHGYSIDKGFRKVVGKIFAVKSELDLRALRGLRYHGLKGNRSHQHSMSINDQWRIVVERIEKDGRLVLLIKSVEDYH